MPPHPVPRLDASRRVFLQHATALGALTGAGAPLALNLRRAVQGLPPQPWRPQARTLNLLYCGGRRAIAAWGGLSVSERGFGRLAWSWKDHIDRGFIARSAAPQAVDGSAPPSLARPEGDHQA